jgi:uncharacterized protein (DUF433 family)
MEQHLEDFVDFVVSELNVERRAGFGGFCFRGRRISVAD